MSVTNMNFIGYWKCKIIALWVLFWCSSDIGFFISTKQKTISSCQKKDFDMISHRLLCRAQIEQSLGPLPKEFMEKIGEIMLRQVQGEHISQKEVDEAQLLLKPTIRHDYIG